MVERPLEEEHTSEDQKLYMKPCNGFLATNETLRKCHVRDIASCMICNHPNETIFHATMDGNLVRSFCDKSRVHQVRQHIQEAPRTSFFDFILWVEDGGGGEAIGEALILAWACWAFHNKVIIDNEIQMVRSSLRASSTWRGITMIMMVKSSPHPL